MIVYISVLDVRCIYAMYTVSLIQRTIDSN